MDGWFGWMDWRGSATLALKTSNKSQTPNMLAD